MNAISRRLGKLENRMGLEAEPLLMVMTRANVCLALDTDTCIGILRESGHLPKGGIVSVYLGNIPDGLNAEETERFLRENGAQICGPKAEHFG